MLIPDEVIVMQTMGLYGDGSKRDAVSLSIVGVTFEKPMSYENCSWFSACGNVP